ncbi:MAG: hypothetical protein GQ561_03110, partial [Calditrichae bacterium]|nr:hypothetical protein [Calditrichia bacterium]
MKTPSRKLILFLLSCLTATLEAQYTPTYVESSQGLNIPALEGGRTELEFADINGDGHLDILSIGDHGSPYINTQQHGVMVWFGDGTGNWSVFQYGNFGYGGIAVGDVNNDGLLDVGYGMHHNYSGIDLGDQLIEVALGDGSGQFWIPWDDGLATNGESWGMFGTDFSDIDNDGDLDIAANSFGSGAGVHVYANQGDGSWMQTFGFLNGNSTNDIVFGEVNNDGYPDFAVAHEYGTVYDNDGTGSFSLADGNLSSAGSLGWYGPDLGDINNDGTDELSFCNSNGGVEIWRWLEGNNWVNMSNNLPATGSYNATQIYDMNMDGYKDITAFGGGIVTIWLGDGSGNWTQIPGFTVPAPGYYRAFRIDGDADHNGFPDIALVNHQGTWINYQNHLRFFKEVSAADSLSIRPIYPGPNRQLSINSIQTIRWISEVPAGDSSRVKLEISLNDSLGHWIIIADSLPNNGHHQWQVPENFGSYAPCRIRYSVYSGTDSASAITPLGFFIGPVVGIDDISRNHLNFGIQLQQNYPNPFNPTTAIIFQLSA